jgi:hypothetical protein
VKKILTVITLAWLYWGLGDWPVLFATTMDLYRCPGGSLISIHDRISEVSRKCGPPTVVGRRQELRNRGYALENIEIEEWTYNYGPTSFMIYLTFENGKLTRIESGEYGY